MLVYDGIVKSPFGFGAGCTLCSSNRDLDVDVSEWFSQEAINCLDNLIIIKKNSLYVFKSRRGFIDSGINFAVLYPSSVESVLFPDNLYCRNYILSFDFKPEWDVSISSIPDILNTDIISSNDFFILVEFKSDLNRYNVMSLCHSLSFFYGIQIKYYSLSSDLSKFVLVFDKSSIVVPDISFKENEAVIFHCPPP